MNKLKKTCLMLYAVLPLAIAPAALLTLSACDGGVEAAGEEIDDAIEKAGDKIEDATDKK